MKILILQLARLGDIYQTWPVIRALRQLHPDAQIDILVRHRFREAVHDLCEVNTVWVMEPRRILAPILENADRWQESVNILDGLLSDLCDVGYDQIFNLSFSPMSSFLTRALQKPETQVCGYTRTDDGYLAIPDDGSAYFYAQVGIDRSNRVHLCDLFAHVCGVDLRPEHWTTKLASPSDFADMGEYVVVHLGASQADKTYGAAKWTSTIRFLLKGWPGQVVLVGAGNESALADHVLRELHSGRVLNFVGRTHLRDLFDLIGHARLVLGCDSAPMHMASLSGTPCLNLSFAAVNFWETGPRAHGSRVLWAEDADSLPSDRVGQEALQMLKHEAPHSPVIFERAHYVAYDATQIAGDRQLFEWQLIEGLYMGGALPSIVSETVLRGFAKLMDLNQLALNELTLIQGGHTHAHSYSILDRVDETIEALTRVVPEVTPLVRWYQTEKIRLGPLPIQELVMATLDIHTKLQRFLFSFTGLDPTQEGAVGHELKAQIG